MYLPGVWSHAAVECAVAAGAAALRHTVTLRPVFGQTAAEETPCAADADWSAGATVSSHREFLAGRRVAGGGYPGGGLWGTSPAAGGLLPGIGVLLSPGGECAGGT